MAVETKDDGRVDNIDDSLHCYESIEDFNNIRQQAMFWVDGVLILVVGVFGLIGNMMSILVLRRCPGNRCFNILLCW